MLNEEKSQPIKVWGITVSISPGGRRKWPDIIKVKAAEHFEADWKVKDIATKIGANKSLVAKWVGVKVVLNTGTAFIEVIKPVVPQDTPPSIFSLSSKNNCQIQIGDIGVTIPVGYPVSYLAEVLRAVRMSQ